MKARLLTIGVLALGAFVPGMAAAQPSTGSNYNVQTLNFDIWCQEEQGLPPDRCDKRLPEDEQIFDAYRRKIEAYEIPYLQRKQNDAQMDRTLLHNDPVDNPVKNDPAALRQDPNQPPLKPPP